MNIINHSRIYFVLLLILNGIFLEQTAFGECIAFCKAGRDLSPEQRACIRIKFEIESYLRQNKSRRASITQEKYIKKGCEKFYRIN